MLSKDYCCDIVLPRIPKRFVLFWVVTVIRCSAQLEVLGILSRRVSILEEELPELLAAPPPAPTAPKKPENPPEKTAVPSDTSKPADKPVESTQERKAEEPYERDKDKDRDRDRRDRSIGSGESLRTAPQMVCHCISCYTC